MAAVGQVMMIVVVVLTTTVKCDDVPCVIDKTVGPGHVLFYINTEKPLVNLQIITNIRPSSTDGCYINTSAIVEDMAVGNTQEMKQVALFCERPGTIIHLTPYQGTRHNDVVLYLHITQCVIDHGSVFTVASIGDMKVVTLQSTSLEDNNNTVHPEHSYDNMRAIVAFSYFNGGFANGDVMDLFSANETYPEMMEIAFVDTNWTSIPESLEQLFPNLQTLEVMRIGLTSIQNFFPWTPQEALLPKNLSRSDVMQNHYAVSELLSIPSNVFRRVYNLAYNSLTEIATPMSGYLQKISLKNNRIRYICEGAFWNVTGLQHLDLSSNELTHLPPGLFRGQTKLRILNLMNNSLVNITADIFKDLTSLEVLILANNSINYIESGAFTKLGKLRQLYLQHNALTEIKPGIFPIDSVKLKKIFLNNNPIKELPEVVFWIRGLSFVDLKFTDITFDNFTEYLINLNSHNIAMSIVDSGSDVDDSDLYQQEVSPTVIDLSFSKIETLTLTRIDKDTKRFAVLLLHFQFILTGNPLHCDCGMNTGVKYINHLIANRTISNSDALFESWDCQTPKELKGRPYMKVKPEETVCPINITDCPTSCECFERPVSGRIIVDCSNKDLEDIHAVLPDGILELVYSGNNIIELRQMDTFDRVFSLDVSYNKITKIAENTFWNMDNLTRLDLRSNLLAYIPESIKRLNLNFMFLSQNPLHCDCNSKWLKYWLREPYSRVVDRYTVSCATDGNDRYVIMDTDDDKFICIEHDNYDDSAVAITSIVSSLMGIVIVALLLVIYTFRLEVKVMLFIYTGAHPFDSDENFTDEYIDCVIVHSGLETDWVMEKLVKLLENTDHNFVVCDMARDFVVGFSFQENLTKTVKHSKRILFLISKDWRPVSDKFAVAWGIAQGKIKETKSNFGIIVTHEIQRDDIDDDDIRLFMRRGRSIDSSERLFEDKVLYYMPLHKTGASQTTDQEILHPPERADILSKCFVNRVFQISDEPFTDDAANVNQDQFKYHSFISYGEDDFIYANQEIVPILEEQNFKCCIPDRDFIVGASKEENILQAIATSLKTIFIISQSHVSDEWSLFTFRAAYEKSLRQRSNHLIVIIKSNVDIENDIEDEEMRHYINNYICLKENDRWFSSKLITSLTTFTKVERKLVCDEKTNDDVISDDDVMIDIPI